MPRSLILLLILLAFGFAGGIWLSNRSVATAVKFSSAPGEAALLQKQVEYLQNQVTALEKENVRLADQLAKQRGGKVDAVHARPPKQDDADPDFKGIAIELLKTRGLQALPMTS
ncbi:MAG: hypothetical protein WCN98_13105, partial [Verrucomicrobiaceae bacterium]